MQRHLFIESRTIEMSRISANLITAIDIFVKLIARVSYELVLRIHSTDETIDCLGLLREVTPIPKLGNPLFGRLLKGAWEMRGKWSAVNGGWI